METVIDGVTYHAVKEFEPETCQGCVAEGDDRLCDVLAGTCFNDGIVWAVKDKVREQVELNKAFGHQMSLFPDIDPPVTAEEDEAFRAISQKQIGGDHYFNAIQPWDIIRAWDLNYWEGNIVKYTLRHKGKGKIEDLEKAKHYLEYLIENYDELY